MPMKRYLLAACLALAPALPAMAQPAPAPVVPSQAPGVRSIEPMSRLDAIMQMQFQSIATEPVPPPMTGEEASAVYQAYLKKRGQSAAPNTTSQPPSAASSMGYPDTAK